MDLWLGVDLGTTFVAAAVARDFEGGPEMFTLGDRSMVAPAVAYLREDGELLVAEAADRREISGADRSAREFKRRLGDPTPVVLGGMPFPATELMAALLAEVLRRIEEVEGRPPSGVVLTHPANWGPFRRGLFEEVPRLAGLSAVRMITEPEAAAYHYAASHDLPDDAPIAVYDLGGGTFDVTVLRRRPGRVELLGVPEGIERLGGVDFDNALLEHVDYVSGGSITELDARDPGVMAALARLRRDCVLAKESLSVDLETVLPVFLPGKHFDLRITREEFEKLIRAPIESTVTALERTLRSAHLPAADLAAVLLVGGSSRIPLVEQMVREALGRPVVVDTHPKYGVALGAAGLALSSSRLERTAAESAPAVGPRAVTVGHSSASSPLRMVSAGAPDGGGEPAPRPRWRGWGKGPATPLVLAALALVAVVVVAGFVVPGLTHSGSTEPTAPTTDSAPAPAPALRGPSVVARIPVGGNPILLALTRDGGRLYGLDRDDRLGGSAGPISWFACHTDTNTRAAGGLLASGANNMAVSGDGSAYFSASKGTEPVLAVVNAETLAESGRLRVGNQPSGIAFAADGHHAYISHIAGFVSLYDVATRRTVATIPGFQKPIGLGLSADGRRLYVSDRVTNTVSVIDTVANQLTATIAVDPQPAIVVSSPDGARVYVTSISAGTVTAIDAMTNTVAWNVRVGSAPYGLAVSPDSRKLYISQRASSSIAVLDTATHLISATVPVGKTPGQMAISEDGSRVYVPEQDSGTVSVIDTGGAP